MNSLGYGYKLTIADEDCSTVVPGREQLVLQENLGDHLWWGGVNEITHNASVRVGSVIKFLDHFLQEQ